MSSINIFPIQSRKVLRSEYEQFLAGKSYGYAPYITIESKVVNRDGRESDAENQNTAASYVHIHQRLELKRALQGTDHIPDDPNDLRHYSIVATDQDFSIWLTKYNIDKKSYRMHLLDEALFNKDGVVKWQKWWNHIHRWGLGPYAQSFRKDLENLIKKKNSNPTE